MTIPEPVPPFIGRIYHAGYELPLWLRAAGDSFASAEHLRLFYCASGAAIIRQGREPERVEGPVLSLLPPSVEAPEAAGGGALVLHFDPSVINSALSIAALGRPQDLTGTISQDAYLLRAFFGTEAGRLLRLDARTDVLVRSALTSMVREGVLQRDENWPCRTRSHLIELLFVLRLALERIAPTRTDGLFDRAVALIQEKLGEKFAVSELARWCGSNRSSLNAAFRAQIGQSVHAYIMQQRMELAATLLRDTGLPVSEILHRVGYENPSHFSRQFRAVLGTSPGAYRRDEVQATRRRKAQAELA